MKRDGKKSVMETSEKPLSGGGYVTEVFAPGTYKVWSDGSHEKEITVSGEDGISIKHLKGNFYAGGFKTEKITPFFDIAIHSTMPIETLMLLANADYLSFKIKLDPANNNESGFQIFRVYPEGKWRKLNPS